MSAISPKIFYSSTSMSKEKKLVLFFSSTSDSDLTPNKFKTIHASSSAPLSSDKKSKKKECENTSFANVLRSKKICTYALRSRKIPTSSCTTVQKKRRRAIAKKNSSEEVKYSNEYSKKTTAIENLLKPVSNNELTSNETANTSTTYPEVDTRNSIKKEKKMMLFLSSDTTPTKCQTIRASSSASLSSDKNEKCEKITSTNVLRSKKFSTYALRSKKITTSSCTIVQRKRRPISKKSSEVVKCSNENYGSKKTTAIPNLLIPLINNELISNETANSTYSEVDSGNSIGKEKKLELFFSSTPNSDKKPTKCLSIHTSSLSSKAASSKENSRSNKIAVPEKLVAEKKITSNESANVSTAYSEVISSSNNIQKEKNSSLFFSQTIHSGKMPTIYQSVCTSSSNSSGYNKKSKEEKYEKISTHAVGSRKMPSCFANIIKPNKAISKNCTEMENSGKKNSTTTNNLDISNRKLTCNENSSASTSNFVEILSNTLISSGGEPITNNSLTEYFFESTKDNIIASQASKWNHICQQETEKSAGGKLIIPVSRNELAYNVGETTITSSLHLKDDSPNSTQAKNSSAKKNSTSSVENFNSNLREVQNFSTCFPKPINVNTNASETLNSNERVSVSVSSLRSEDISLKNIDTRRSADKDLSNYSESSVLQQTESLSEYIPDSTYEITVASGSLKSNNTYLRETEKSVQKIQSPVHITKLTVPYSSQSKKHFCIFCKTMQTKISRHLLLKHKAEKEIKAISNLHKNHIDRVNTFNKLRKDGDFLHNTNHSLNSGILIVSRQQHSKSKNKPDDYLCCRNCKGFFSKRSLKFHLRNCCELRRNDRSNMIWSRKITQYIHEDANDIMKTIIFPVLRNDKITVAIWYDDLIIKYGNKMSEKYTLAHQHDMVRAQLRLLGRFKICVQELCPTIENFKDIFRPQMYNTCITALRKVANWDSTLMWFKTPAVAQSLTSLIKKCGYKQRTEFIKVQQDALKKELDDFLLLWEEEVPTLINKKANEDQANQKRNKKIVLPSKEDIKKLYVFLKNKINVQIKVLENKFCSPSWIELIKATLIFIQIFNRRRAGEIERLTLSNYKNKEVITDNIGKGILRNMSAESFEFARQFVRIIIRGKLGRTVSVLLSPLCITAIDLIIKHRDTAGITTSNEYIFCKTGFSKVSKEYFRACPLLRQFSMECGAAIPESLRGTTLRKHIATYTSLLNVEEATVDKLANFMGHHKDIHKNIYRMSVPVAEITCVSKLLMNAIVDDSDEENDEIYDGRGADDVGRNNDEGNGEMNHYMAEEDEQRNNKIAFVCSDSAESCTSEEVPKKKKRSTSPYGKTKRCRWTEEERQAIKSHFGCLKDLMKLPTIPECHAATKKFPILKSRTPQQIKSWIDNQRRYKKQI